MNLLARLRRLPRQLSGRSPFQGSLSIDRLPLWDTGLATVRHFRTPLKILDFVFKGDEDLRYLDVPGFPPILFIRDPELIRQITIDTGPSGSFDRDTLPTQGIARVVGGRNLLFARGEEWRRHRVAAARPFGATAHGTQIVYHDIEQAVRRAVEPQLEAIAQRVRRSPTSSCRLRLGADIQAVMLTVLVNVLFGADVSHDELRCKYLSAMENVIRYILIDTVANPLGVPFLKLPALTARHAQWKKDRRTFEELVERVMRARGRATGFWHLLTKEGPDEAIASNVRVFLAGALEATSSYLGWALVELARHPSAQERARAEADRHVEIGPASRENAPYLRWVMEESLRLHNALYFLPRVAVREATVATSKGTLTIPADTHIVLATYHANRCERYWGVQATGFPALAFAPERWDDANWKARGRSDKDNLHYGFGHGPRVCIGKHFSEAELFVCLTLFLRRFEFRAPGTEVAADSGVSTRPSDNVDLWLTLRTDPASAPAKDSSDSRSAARQ